MMALSAARASVACPQDMSVNPTPLRVVSTLTSDDANRSGSTVDGVVAAEMTESAFGSDGMLTGRAWPCHAAPKGRGYALITNRWGCARWRAVRCTDATRYRAAQSLCQQPRAVLPGSAEAGRIPPENQAGKREHRNGFLRIIVDPGLSNYRAYRIGRPGTRKLLLSRRERRTSVVSALPCHVPARARALALTGDSRGARSS